MARRWHPYLLCKPWSLKLTSGRKKPKTNGHAQLSKGEITMQLYMLRRNSTLLIVQGDYHDHRLCIKATEQQPMQAGPVVFGTWKALEKKRRITL
jgi:hypothetical protein